MTQVQATAQYGMRELKSLYQKYAFIGLSIAALLHFGIIGVYYLVGYLQEEEEPVVMVRITKYSELGPPPSMTNTETAPAVQVSAPVARPTVGVPVPVPDAEVSPEQTIATQEEMSAVQSPVTSMDGDGGGIQIEQDMKVELDEDPPDFVPVEKSPVPVKQIPPEYPDIAKRAGVQGTVWVKCLVDKEGKVKKAVVMKSDAEIFNEPAIQAALQWVFTPAIMNNGPVAVWAAIPFRFVLNK
ncbi:MAG: energy transducer TonB [Ignavibacteriales bacterium]|nr:energy transducer TonB [Ignavibacteriales bacterium]